MSKHKRTNSAKNKYVAGIQETSDVSKTLAKYLQFNFKYYNHQDLASQSFENWQDNKILADLNNKLCDFSKLTIEELKSMGNLVVYGAFPDNSDFKEPNFFKGINVQWARLRLTGRRRLIGVFIPSDDTTLRNIFYVVFLDKNHKFCKVNL